jgi:hypothetical protein
MRDGLLFVRHVRKSVNVAARCLLDQFISVLPLCICISSPFTELNSHTQATGLIFLQLAVNKTLSLAPNATGPFIWRAIYILYVHYKLCTINSRGDTATGIIPHTYSFDFAN